MLALFFFETGLISRDKLTDTKFITLKNMISKEQIISIIAIALWSHTIYLFYILSSLNHIYGKRDLNR